MTIGENDESKEASAFSWFTVFSVILSVAALIWVSSFKFSSKEDLGLPSNFDLSEHDFARYYYSTEAMRQNQENERNNLYTR